MDRFERQGAFPYLGLLQLRFQELAEERGGDRIDDLIYQCAQEGKQDLAAGT